MARHARIALLAAALSILLAPLAARPDATYQSRVVDANQVGLTVTNHGFLGNNFIDRTPSLEYPLGAGYEHMTHGGLWVGAHAADAGGAFTGVVTGCLDINIGTASPPYTEWTPMSDFVVRSSAAGPYYDPAAISALDVFAEYDDHVAKRTQSNPEDHRPMGIAVRQESFAWTTSGLERVLFVRFVIRNTGGQPLADAWVGLYTELASGSKNAYSCWPPSSGCGPGGWFSKKWIGWDGARRLLREHYCASQPVPSNCNLAAVPPWIGLELLTHPAAGQSAVVAAWNYAPGDPSRDQDVERYALLSGAAPSDPSSPAFLPGTGDPVELTSLGPFAIASGDSVRVDFALVGGGSLEELQTTADLAQAHYDLGSLDGPTPVAASLVSAESAPDRVRLTWWSPSAIGAATVERRTEASAWSAVGTAAARGDGYTTFEDRDVRPGDRLGYRLSLGTDHTAEAWVVVPARAEFALLGVRPNPVAGGEPVAAFSLGSAEPATLELFDLSGRRARVARLASPAPGEHLLRLEGATRLAPGVYALRLTQADRRAVARVIVTR